MSNVEKGLLYLVIAAFLFCVVFLFLLRHIVITVACVVD